MSVLKVRFGKRIRFLREQLHLTQEGLAEKVQLSKDFIGMIERGERAPSFESLEAISRALNIPIKNLFDDEEIK